MGEINISGHMARKAVTRDIRGQIINMMDETDGGWVIRNRQVVNPEKYQKILDVENDRKMAAQAIQHQKVEESAPDRTAAPSKIDALEARIDAQDGKLDAILAALTKKE